jgi:hypothetical protein
VWGERGVATNKGQKGERATTRVSMREKRNDATFNSYLASNGPQPLPHIRALKINLWQPFLGYYRSLSRSHPISIEESATGATNLWAFDALL